MRSNCTSRCILFVCPHQTKTIDDDTNSSQYNFFLSHSSNVWIWEGCGSPCQCLTLLKCPHPWHHGMPTPKMYYIQYKWRCIIVNHGGSVTHGMCFPIQLTRDIVELGLHCYEQAKGTCLTSSTKNRHMHTKNIEDVWMKLKIVSAFHHMLGCNNWSLTTWDNMGGPI